MKEYQELCQKATLTYYLFGKEAEELDKLAEEGLKEYKGREIIKADSLREALKTYERRNKQNKRHRILKKNF